MSALEERARRAGERAARHAAERVEAALREAIGDAAVARSGDTVTITAWGLSVRRMRDPALRWIAGVLR